MAVITSLEVNYLIFRYLHESGHIHSAYTLCYEAGLNTMTVDGNLPPGAAALASCIQKGLQYLELEANVNEDGTDMDGDFILLTPLELITKKVDELRQLVKERRKEKEMLKANLNEGGTGDSILTKPLELITKNVDEPRQLVKGRKELRGKLKTKAGKPGAKRSKR